MTYREQYYAIIDFRRKNPLPEGEYGEKHHIVPKSLGGSNEKENIVRLTPEEHYKCHCILPYMYLEEGDENGYHKMLYAWTRFIGKERENHKDMVPVDIDRGSEEYGRLKREYVKMVSESLKGNQHAKGHVPSEEVKRKTSETLKGRIFSEETRRKISEARKGQPSNRNRKGCHLSEEHKRKLSEANKGKPSNRKGCHLSEEHKRKISESQKGNQRWKGRHHSEESRRKMSEARKRYWNMKKSNILMNEEEEEKEKSCK